MASIRKTKEGTWRAEVMVNYKRKSKTFTTKAEANAWALDISRDLASDTPQIANKTFGDLLDKYCNEVSSQKAGERWERIRIALFKRDKIADIPLPKLSKQDFADWRDRRLKEITPRSVIREWALLSHALNVAVKEWEWLPDNPMKNLIKPKGSPPRERVPTQEEIELICHTAGYFPDQPPTTIISRAAAAFLFAIETGMRAQEICNLIESDINGKVAKVRKSKTRAGIREVPLSTRALEIIEHVRHIDIPGDSIFNITTSQLDSNFRKAMKLANITGLHFHDSRAEATVRLSKKVPILVLARILGHTDLRMLMVHYRESAAEIANLLR